MNSDELQKIQDFIINEIKQHTPLSKVSLVNFGSDVVVESRLTSDQEYLLKAVQNVKKIGGATGKLDLAMAKVRDDIFTRRFQNLPLRQVVLITPVLNNLQNKNDVLRIVKDIQDGDNVKVTIVSVGDSGSNFDDITSGKGANLQVDLFEEMPSIVDDVFALISENAGKM